MKKTGFTVDKEKCIGCGRCINVCPGGILFMNQEREIQMADFEEFGWNGCWKCEHCLAVCPAGAISIFGHEPENSILPAAAETAAPVMDALIANRHSCRRYKNRDVEPGRIRDMMNLLANAPNGGNKQQVEFTLIDDRERMDRFRSLAFREMERLAGQGIYPKGFDQESYEDMKRWRSTVRPDMLFCGAPHLLIPHAPLGKGEPVQDVLIAGAYFELICASRGLGAVMLTFPLEALERMPKIRAMLEIPEEHYIGMLIGFGYPEIPYARGVQKTLDESRIQRPEF